MNPESPFFILNPTSGGGRTRRLWDKIAPRIPSVFDSFEVVLTESPGDATRQAALALKAGYRSIVAVGGDGSLHEVLNGFFEGDRLISPEASLVTFPLGSGNDFARSLNWPKDPLESLRHLKKNKPQKIDVGKATFQDANDRKSSRYFLNIADFGLGGVVMNGVNASSKFWGSRTTYLYHSLKALLRYRPTTVCLDVDGERREFSNVVIGVVANGRYFASGLCVAPQADFTDGLFDVIVVQKIGAFDLIRWLPSLYRGEPVQNKNIHRFRARRLQVSPLEQKKVLIVADGEQPGSLPAEFELLPRAIPFHL